MRCEQSGIQTGESWLPIQVLYHRARAEAPHSLVINKRCLDFDFDPTIRGTLARSVLDLKVIDADTDADTDAKSSQMENHLSRQMRFIT